MRFLDKKFRALAFPAAAVALTAIVALQGCAPTKTGIRTTQVSPSASATPKPNLVEVRPVVDSAAGKAALASVQDQSVTPDNVQTFMTAAQWLFNQGKYKDASTLFQKSSTDGPKGEATLRAQYLVGECYYESNQYLAALSAYQKVLDLSPNSDYGKQSRLMMTFMLKYSLDESTLAQFVANYPDSPLACEGQFQLGRRQADGGGRVEALQTLKSFLAKCPRHPSAEDARILVQGLETGGSGKARRIGVLVPLTGSYAAFGQSVADGVKLALEKANQSLPPDEQVEPILRDTQGDSVEAVKAARALIQDDQVDAIIGPVTGSETAAVAAVTNPLHALLICPAASRDGFSSIGPYVFRNSLTNELQGRAIAQYAVQKMGLKRFAILSPQDAYGDVLSSSFRGEVEALGSTIVAAVTYPPNTTDFRQALTTLGGRNPSVDKENDRENQRRGQELAYSLKKATLKALLPIAALGKATTVAAAWAPFAEGYTNTECPRAGTLVAGAVQDGFSTLQGPVRSTDLATQALSRLPSEMQGNTVSASLDDWAAVMADLQVNLLVTGAVIETDSVAETGVDPTWDYQVRLDSFYLAPGATEPKASSVTLKYQAFKGSEFVRDALTFDALYLPAHTPDVPLVTSQLRFYDLHPQLLGGHLWENDSVVRDGGDAVNGAVFVTGFWAESSLGPGKDFVTAFGAKYGRKPDLLAAQSYDAARMLLEVFRGSQNREEVRSRLSQLKDFKGASGDTSFNGDGNAQKILPILQIQNGKVKQLQ